MKSTELQGIKQRYNIVGNCDALNHVLDVALQVAPTDLSVLIIGESGVGKEIIPRVIHDNSPRRREKYFAINCGAIPEGTIDSELFGHVKGSYTGAINDSPGYFGVANKGTLFLDEVGELPLATQARLLRVLETGEYIPVGGTETRKTDVRIVAATNLNIQKAISEGRFREDLFYRLNSIPLQMPPLRERGEDVVLLFRLFAMQMAEKYKMDRVVLTEEAKQMLMRYKWPGNVRQLKNITEQISVLSKERTITADILAKFIPQDRESTQLATIPRDGGDHSFENEREILYKILFELRGNVNDMRRDISQLKKQIEDVQPASANSLQPMTPINPIQPMTPIQPALEDAIAEEYIEPVKEPENLNLNDLGRQMLEKALERNNGNRKKAAQELGISDRTLYRRLKQFGLAVIACLMLLSCSVSYKLNGASIDYTKTKTIQIADFPIRSSYVWAPMGGMFNNELKDQFANHTKLTQVKRNGDLKLEGEITRYDQRNKSVSSEGYSAQTELSMTVNVRFTNNKKHDEDFERTFTATSSYDSSQSLSSVQEDLVNEMIKNICDQIFNATVANW
ncbi:MAG: sigma 54-interacting transcriptional regulator [Prevotella sp.]|jgi:DNA-binding NtrC family response regulator|nr:sigma 54-interacting transcriptional regulator [Prevotella sp.]